MRILSFRPGRGAPRARPRVFPATARQIELELVQTRTFGSKVVYLRYRRRHREGLRA